MQAIALILMAISLDLKDASLVDALKQIEQQSGLRLAYDQELIEKAEPVTLKVEGVPTVGIGHSEIVGKPVVNILLGMNATVSCCHIFTDPDFLKEKVKEADILFIATGKRQYGWSQHAKAYKAWWSTCLPRPFPRFESVRGM